VPTLHNIAVFLLFGVGNAEIAQTQRQQALHLPGKTTFRPDSPDRCQVAVQPDLQIRGFIEFRVANAKVAKAQRTQRVTLKGIMFQFVEI